MGGRGSGGGRSGGGGGASKSLSEKIKNISQQVVTRQEFEDNYNFYNNLSDKELVEAVKIAKQNFNKANKKFEKLESTGVSQSNVKLRELSDKASNLNNSLKNAERVLKNRGINTDWKHSPYGGWYIDNVTKGGGASIRRGKDKKFIVLGHDKNGEITYRAKADTLAKAKKLVKTNMGIGSVNRKRTS